MISVRRATHADLPGILDVEQNWPEDGRADADKFKSRLEKFPQGFFLACLQDERGDEVIAATITSMPLQYRSGEMDAFSSWDKVTSNGYLPECDLACSNALYIVSGVIDRRFRGLDIFAPMVLRVAEQAKTLGLRYLVAGAVIPGYQKFCHQHGDIGAFEYCSTRRGHHLVDPLLAMYEAIGFKVPDERHVIANYYPDDASRNFAAMVVRDLQLSPLD